jgi:hypothetical protein
MTIFVVWAVATAAALFFNYAIHALDDDDD